MQFVTYSGWSELPDSANQLFKQAEKDSVFFSRPWFENLAAHSLKDGESILLACVIEQDEVLAILPLIRTPDDALKALSNLYSSLYGLLIKNDQQQAILDCLAKGISELSFFSLSLGPIASDDKVMGQFQKALEDNNITVERSFRFFNWIHRFQGQTYDAYMSERPTIMRKMIERKSRKIEREHGLMIRMYQDGDLQQVLADYNAIYSSSWKVQEPVENFIDHLANKMAQAGWLRLAVLYIGGQPVAAQFWFVVHGKASIFRLAYDEVWKAYSPGSILTAYLVKHVMDVDQVESMDFLTGNEKYKQDWMSERRERVALICKKSQRTDSLLNRVVNYLFR